MLSFTYCVLLLWNDWSFQRKQKFISTRLIKSPLYVHFIFSCGNQLVHKFFCLYLLLCIKFYCYVWNYYDDRWNILWNDKNNVPCCINPWESLRLQSRRFFLVTCTQIIMAIYHIAVNRCLQAIYIVKQDLSIALSLHWNFLFQQISIAIYFLFTFIAEF
jgi:hypothetical protein